ncbi:MAG: sigma-70 family RNA polymerase sigma factor, partial [Fimbriimonadaceae bacterium]
VQQTLLRAFTAWERFDGARLRPWLLRILSNENLARFRGPTPPQQFAENESDQPFEDNLWDTVLTRDQVQRILTNLDKLELHYRLAVQLCDVEGLSYEEASQALDVPMGTIRSRLFRGRAMLRDLVLNDGGDIRE